MTTAKPSRIRMLARGATRRCARCGAGGLFHKWFRMVPDCPRCGLHFEREEGYWSGAIAINTIIIGGIFAIVFIATMALTVPDIPIMSIGPLIVYPFSKTLWLAVDLAFLEPLGIRLDGG